MPSQEDIYVKIITDVKQSLGGLAKLGAAYLVISKGIKTIINIAKASIAAYAMQEQAVAKLSAAIIASGRAGEMSVYGLTEYASALQKVTTHGDETIISAMAMLQQLSDLDEKGLKEITPSVLDFADAMGVDLQTAASLVGKTLGSSTNALSRYGISIDMTGTKEQKLAELTAVLTKKFGGMSQAIANTATGSMKQMQNAFGDLQEIMGEVSVKTARPFMEWLTDIATKAAESWKHINLITEAIGNIKTGIKESDLEKMGAQLKAMKEELARLTDGFYRGKLSMTEYMQYQSGALQTAIKLLEQQTDLEMKRQARTKAATKAEKDKLDAEIAASEERIALVKKMDDAYALTDEARIIAAQVELAWHKANLKALQESGGYTERAVAIVKMYQEAYDGLIGAKEKAAAAAEKERAAAEEYEAVLWRQEDVMDKLGGLTAWNTRQIGDMAAVVAVLNEGVKELNESLGLTFSELGKQAFQDTFEAIGAMIVDMDKGLESLKEVAMDTFAAMLQALGKYLLEMAVMALPNLALAAMYAAGAAAAFVASGAVASLDEGGVTTGITPALLHPNEAIIPLDRYPGIGGGPSINIYGDMYGAGGRQEFIEDISKALARNQARGL